MLKLVPLICVVIGLIAALLISTWIVKGHPGNPEMKGISRTIRKCANLFERREAMPLGIVVVAVSLILGATISWKAAILYFSGAFLSAVSTFFGIYVADKGSLKTASLAKIEGIRKSYKISVRSGAVLGLSVAVLSLLGIGAFVIILKLKNLVEIIACFAFGASTIALWRCVSGEIFDAAAKISSKEIADNMNGVEYDDMNNPVLLADKAGNLIGRFLGVGSDLFDSYTASIVAAVALAAVAVKQSDITSTFTLTTAAQFPLIIAGIGLVASIIGILLLRINYKGSKNGSLLLSSFVSSIIIAASSFYFSNVLLQSYVYAVAITLGLVCAMTIGNLSDLKLISQLSSVLLVSVAVVVSYLFVGIYGVALVAVGMISIIPLSVTYEVLSSIADNAATINKLSSSSEEDCAATDSLAELAEKTAGIGKGYSMGAAVLSALGLYIAFASAADLSSVSLLEPIIMVGLLIGAMLPAFYLNIVNNSVKVTSEKFVSEAKRQIRDDQGILNGSSLPDFHRCTEVGASKATQEVLWVLLVIALAPVVIGLIFGLEVLGSLLAGVLVSGFVVAMSNKNNCGITVNTLIKSIIIISLVAIPLFERFGGLLFK